MPNSTGSKGHGPLAGGQGAAAPWETPSVLAVLRGGLEVGGLGENAVFEAGGD